MSNITQLLSAYMDNIIQLLQSLVKSVQENNQLIQKNQQLLIETNNIIKSISNTNPEGLAEMSNSLQDIVGQLQKGIQAFKLNSIIDDIKDIMKKIGYKPSHIKSEEDSKETEIPASEITQEFKAGLNTTPKKDDDEDHVIRPSSFLQ
ncbi:MAG: hypothetical protein ACTSWR_09530 [Candidatus Helarchaeota archaeon]